VSNEPAFERKRLFALVANVPVQKEKKKKRSDYQANVNKNIKLRERRN